ncbi:MAG TPA: toast rack family protein [Anaerolineales bacterium]|nr:toast rack family protein [Anaerolineales bacterium]
MNPKYPFQFILAALIIASLSCSFANQSRFRKLEIGPLNTVTLSEPYPGTSAIQDVTLSMAVGELTLSGGAETLIEGKMQYNVEGWKPNIEYKNNALTISQEAEFPVNGFPGDDVVNIWDLKLGQTPMNLVLTADAYDATLNLSGLPIHSMVVQDGASNSVIRFDTLNPAEMQELTYQTGASEITFLGLAHANFAQMSFDGGVGEYTFDFAGDLQRDAVVNIYAGLSNVRIIVPEGMAARVAVDDGLRKIYATGAWKVEGGKYANDGAGPLLTIVVDMGAGELHLMNP